MDRKCCNRCNLHVFQKVLSTIKVNLNVSLFPLICLHLGFGPFSVFRPVGDKSNGFVNIIRHRLLEETHSYTKQYKMTNKIFEPIVYH